MIGFVLKYWKYIAIILAVIGLVTASISWYNSKLENAYNNGVKTERLSWEKRVAEENKKNRQFETNMISHLDELSIKIDESNSKRYQKETVVNEKIQTIVKEVPVFTECVAPKEAIDARNEIRKMGPSQ